MNAKTSFNAGLRIGDRAFGKCLWHDDQFVTLQGNTVSIFSSAVTRDLQEVYTVPDGTEVYGIDEEGEFLLGTV